MPELFIILGEDMTCCLLSNDYSFSNCKRRNYNTLFYTSKLYYNSSFFVSNMTEYPSTYITYYDCFIDAGCVDTNASYVKKLCMKNKNMEFNCVNNVWSYCCSKTKGICTFIPWHCYRNLIYSMTKTRSILIASLNLSLI